MCKQDLQQICKQHLSWAGRTAAFKMITLPKLLYIYRALPIAIPDSFFSTLKRTISSFVWLKWKPRCPYATSMKQKSTGGMGFPDVKDYHVAVILDQIKHWFAPTFNKQ